MKKTRSAVVALLVLSVLGSPLASLAGDKAAEKPKPYPLKTCIISGDKLGEMGDPVVYVQDGREIKFCCKSCVKDFKKEPAKDLKKIDEEVAKEKEEVQELLTFPRSKDSANLLQGWFEQLRRQANSPE